MSHTAPAARVFLAMISSLTKDLDAVVHAIADIDQAVF
jgi:hypothetical protein